MKINKFLVPVIIVVALMGSIGIAKMTNSWTDVIDVNTMSAPDQIRGWMTFEQVSNRFNIPLEELYEKTGIPKDTPPDTPIRDMEGENFDTELVREVVAEKLGVH